VKEIIMSLRPWEPAWKAYKDAREEEIEALEVFLMTPSGDKESHRALLAAKRKVRDAEIAFFEAFDATQSIKR
jgi:hypothetical protein